MSKPLKKPFQKERRRTTTTAHHGSNRMPPATPPRHTESFDYRQHQHPNQLSTEKQSQASTENLTQAPGAFRVAEETSSASPKPQAQHTEQNPPRRRLEHDPAYLAPRGQHCGISQLRSSELLQVCLQRHKLQQHQSKPRR